MPCGVMMTLLESSRRQKGSQNADVTRRDCHAVSCGCSSSVFPLGATPRGRGCFLLPVVLHFRRVGNPTRARMLLLERITPIPMTRQTHAGAGASYMVREGSP